MLDERYLELQHKVDFELNQVDESQLKAGKVIEPINVFSTKLDLQHYKALLRDTSNASFIVEYSKAITMLDNIDEWFYNAETGKGLTFDELQDYYYVIREALGYNVTDYNTQLKVIDKMITTLVDNCDFEITDIDFYKAIRIVSVDDELVEQVNLMKREHNDTDIMKKVSRITELSDYKDKGVSYVVENACGYDLLSKGQLTTIFDFLNEWINDNVDVDDVHDTLAELENIEREWY